MAGVPRSQALLQWRSTAAAQTSPAWTTPDNTVTLVKSLILVNASTSATLVNMLLNHGGIWAFAAQQWALDPAARVLEESWFVLNPNDSVSFSSEQAETYVWLSGAVLLGPPPFPPAATQLPAVEPDR